MLAIGIRVKDWILRKEGHAHHDRDRRHMQEEVLISEQVCNTWSTKIWVERSWGAAVWRAGWNAPETVDAVTGAGKFSAIAARFRKQQEQRYLVVMKRPKRRTLCAALQRRDNFEIVNSKLLFDFSR